MNYKLNKTLYLALALLIGVMQACGIDRQEEIETIKQEFYLINSLDFIEKIERGEHVLNSITKTRPESVPPSNQLTVNWDFSDYLLITYKVFSEVWMDTENSWSLNNMTFRLGCMDIENGFQNGVFEYFKNIKMSEGEIRLVRTIDIDPRNNFIYIWERKSYPRIVDWSVVDFEDISVFPYDALKIAEENGGLQVRSDVGNLCSVTLALTPDVVGYKGWHVLYTNQNEQKELLSLSIDPVTGLIKR